MAPRSGLCATLGIDVPLICGAMYPCSNPELVAAVSEAGGIGIVQPLSLTYVHGYEFREGLRYIRSLTAKPIGVNLIIERSSRKYLERVQQWLDIALEEQVPFLVTALGNPNWVVDRAAPAGVTVYHDVTSRQWAEKALDGGVDGFICVNNRAGGHAGTLSLRALLDDIGPLGKPLVCAGGIGTPGEFAGAHKNTLYRERGYPCGAGSQVDAARAPHQALDAYPVFTAVDLEAETGFPAGHTLQGYLPGRQECCGYPCDPASG
jgi:NAD(P)H-dependent flavin oxidoreductase YrpB (nitropropane dioxygenase family)